MIGRTIFQNILKTNLRQRFLTTCPDSSKDSTILVEKLGEITTIGINRPEKRNCIDIETANKLSEAIIQFENDDASTVAVLHGVGGNFCSGFDINELSQLEDNPQSLLEKNGTVGPTHRFIKKPLIGAISGYAVAEGMELALLCDLRVVEETAIMGLYARRFGVPLINGGTVRLQAIVGFSRALDIILTERSISGKEAVEMGLANRIVSCGTAFGQAINLAVCISKFPQECLNVDRASTYYNTFCAKSFEDAIKYESNNVTQDILRRSIHEAKRFQDGFGKHGKYHVFQKTKRSWENDTVDV